MDPRFRPITVNGMTGAEPEPDREAPNYVPSDGDPEQRAAWQAAQQETENRYWGWRVARYHRHLIPLVQEAAPAWAAVEAAQAEYEKAWEALVNAGADRWASAHFAWVQTQEPVRRAIAYYCQFLGPIDRLHWSAIGGERTMETYNRSVPAELNLSAAHWDDADHLISAFESACQERETAAARTLGRLQTA